MKSWQKLIISLIIPQLIAAAGAYFTVTGVGSWYREINRPEWNPPSWVFGPVWTLLYIMMGIALFLVWRSNAPANAKRQAVILWSAQLLFNFFWSLIFFGLQQPGWAFAEIVVLWLLILLTIFAFARISKLAAWLLVPYISWVSFAGMLNFAIWQMN
jgi:translocator protein